MRQLVALAPKVRHDLCRPPGLKALETSVPRPHGTGLLIAGPSVLKHPEESSHSQNNLGDGKVDDESGGIDQSCN